MIYVAHPYTTGNTGMTLNDILVRVGRFAFDAYKAGFHCFHPVLHGENMLRYSGNFDNPETHKYAFWEENDKHMLSVTDELWIHTIPGWVKSEGVIAEIKAYTELNPHSGKVKVIQSSINERRHIIKDIDIRIVEGKIVVHPLPNELQDPVQIPFSK